MYPVRSHRPSRARWVALFVTALGAGACASGSGGGGGSMDIIAQEQLDESVGASAFEVIQRYRPRWLRPARNQNTLGGRATTADRAGLGGDGDVMPGQELYPRVYMDGTFFGDIDDLSRISSDALTSIEFIDGRDATTRFGTGNVAGVIELHSRGLDAR